MHCKLLRAVKSIFYTFFSNYVVAFASRRVVKNVKLNKFD